MPGMPNTAASAAQSGAARAQKAHLRARLAARSASVGIARRPVARSSRACSAAAACALTVLAACCGVRCFRRKVDVSSQRLSTARRPWSFVVMRVWCSASMSFLGSRALCTERLGESVQHVHQSDRLYLGARPVHVHPTVH